jgi:hypothetical protein
LFIYSGKSETNSVILLFNERFTVLFGNYLKKFLDNPSVIVSETITPAGDKRLRPAGEEDWLFKTV